MDSIPHLYNLLGPKSWEEMRPYANEKFIFAPLTPYSADRLTAIGLVWISQRVVSIDVKVCLVMTYLNDFDCVWNLVGVAEEP